MIRRVISMLSVAMVAGTSLMISAPASQAAGVDYVSGTGGKIPYQSCKSFNYRWAASDDSGTAQEWEATATLYDPSGEISDTDEVWGYGDTANESEQFSVCWGEGAGTYSIEIDVTFYDSDYYAVDSGYGYGSMKITREARPARKATRSHLRVSDRTPRYNQVVTFVVSSKVRRNGSWRPNGSAYMKLIGRCSAPRGDSGWVTMAKGEVGRRGVGHVKFRYNLPRSYRCRFASVTTRSSTTKSSKSARVSVRTTSSTSRTLQQNPFAPRGSQLAELGNLADLLG